jgi:thiamine biosynthesis lipoprotein
VGKGLAADFVAGELTALGATGVCVNLGGDLRVHGDGPDGTGWLVELEHPLSSDAARAWRSSGPDSGAEDLHGLGQVHLASGAVASTWRTRRAWGAPDDRRHHVIDPELGTPAETGLAGVVAITKAAWWAEVLATAAFLSGDGAGALLEAHSAAGLAVADDGTVREAGRMGALRPCWA